MTFGQLSDGTMVPYMYISYTVHVLSEDWQLQNRCLQTKFLSQNHTGDIIADSMEETLSMWELKAETQVCITTDSGANVIEQMQPKKTDQDCLVSAKISIWELPSHWQMTQGIVEHWEFIER